MSSLAASLKKQNEFLQGEVERFANAVDNLAEQLVEAQNRIKTCQGIQPEMIPAEHDETAEDQATGPEPAAIVKPARPRR